MMAEAPDQSDDKRLALARRWVARGPEIIDALGSAASQALARGHRLLEASSDSARAMRSVADELMPLLGSFRRSAGRPRWLQWFLGERLEREVMRDQLRHRIDALCQQGERALQGLQRQRSELAAEATASAQAIRRLDAEMDVGRLMGADALASERQVAGFTDEDLARLSRRLGNLEAISAAAQLSLAQFRLAAQNARALSDRFIEIRAVVLPLWEQAATLDRMPAPAPAPLDQTE